MPKAETALPEHYLRPGESVFVTEPSILRTLLGSCVGVAFLAPRLGLGALCHPMLPRYPEKPPADRSVETARRYVDFAIRELTEKFDAHGAQRKEVQIKLFGGADVLISTAASKRPTVGRMNCEAALAALAEHGFAIAASSLGGKSGIQINFNTVTGEVLLRRFN